MLNGLFLNRNVLTLDLGEKKNLKPYCVFQHGFSFAFNGCWFSHAGAVSRLWKRQILRTSPQPPAAKARSCGAAPSPRVTSRTRRRWLAGGKHYTLQELAHGQVFCFCFFQK